MTIDTTPKPEWKEKVWGKTKCIVLGTNFEVHELRVVKGGYCSKHRHRKWNLFHVIAGRLRVELFNGDETTGRILSDGDEFRVPPDVTHRFVAESDCHLLETYWTNNIDPNDIVRDDEGGVLTL